MHHHHMTVVAVGQQRFAAIDGVPPLIAQATAFLMSSPILASVAASSEVMFHTTGCMLTLSSRAGFIASPKPKAMKSLPV